MVYIILACVCVVARGRRLAARVPVAICFRCKTDGGVFCKQCFRQAVGSLFLVSKGQGVSVCLCWFFGVRGVANGCFVAGVGWAAESTLPSIFVVGEASSAKTHANRGEVCQFWCWGYYSCRSPIPCVVIKICVP